MSWFDNHGCVVKIVNVKWDDCRFGTPERWAHENADKYSWHLTSVECTMECQLLELRMGFRNAESSEGQL